MSCVDFYPTANFNEKLEQFWVDMWIDIDYNKDYIKMFVFNLFST